MAWPTCHLWMEREVENQVAAPTETRTPNWHRANQNRSSKSADGRVATVATGARGKTCPTKKQKNPLDSDRPSHGRPLHALTMVKSGHFARASPLASCHVDPRPMHSRSPGR